jgi:fructose-1,6-bisphosphatase
MRSIKEKSFELFPEMQTDSDDWDVIEAQCDRDEQRKAFVKGANYVLEEILDKTSKCITIKDAYEAFLECVEQLKK